jgi:hypothetical protein
MIATYSLAKDGQLEPKENPAPFILVKDSKREGKSSSKGRREFVLREDAP